MRDALSILDKIVSFTNGELNYATTLEHLNILDADCYFNLLDCMQHQDLSGALLLYDDINRKGFEGDLVLNGLAEFIRNLLVCKDEKAAGLLEVVESFKDKYITVAKQVSPALLISALNILNDTEINYKSARNKRLHVEMALIKLCYLQQAISITAEGSAVSKKKLIESPLAFRSAPIKSFGGKQTVAVPVVSGNTPTTITNQKTDAAKLIIETPSPKKIIPQEETTSSSEPKIQKPTGSKLSALDKIRKQYQGNGNGDTAVVNQPLELESLQKAWAAYVVKLKEARNPAAQSFDLAALRIKDDNSFEAVTANNIEQKFIEQDRNHLFAFLKEQLNNRSLQFTVLIEEKASDRPVVEIPLNSKEQYQKMIDQYPLVKELKERLRLDLDY